MAKKQVTSKIFERLRTKDKIIRLALVVVTYLVCITILVLTIQPKTFTIAVGDIATETIQAPWDVEDSYTTNLMGEAAAADVADIYRLNNTKTSEVILSIEECFDSLEDVRVLASLELKKLIEQAAETQRITETIDENESQVEPIITPAPTQVPVVSIIPELSESYIEELSAQLPISLSFNDIQNLANKSSAELSIIRLLVIEKVTNSLNSGIKAEYLEQQISNINQDIINPINGLDESAQRIAMTVISEYLDANFIYDQQATDVARQEAMDSVHPIVYQKGQNITIAGELVTEEQYLMLSALGLLEEDSLVVFKHLSLSLLMLLLFIITGWYIVRYRPVDFRKIRNLASLCLIVILATVVAFVGTIINYYFTLMSLCALLVAVLLDKREALFMVVIFSLIQAIVMYTGADGSFTDVIPVLTINVVGGIFSVNLIATRPQRSKIIIAGLIIGAVNLVISLCFGILQYTDWIEIGNVGLMTFAGGLLASIICLGILPIWEIVFKILTPMRLLEYTNPEQPLLKKMLVEAPGTYHHSIIVGNMAEAAAEAIDANPLLVRAGASYHDIGKLKRPYFFKENQMGLENPHDKIDPFLSTRIILSHTTDGLALAREYKLPNLLQDIIVQHQGTTPVMYFYNMAKQIDDTVDINDFRYSGPTPRSNEAAIIMLADSVEAAVRSMDSPSREKIRVMIDSIIKTKLDDKQLDYSQLTMADLKTIANVFARSLSGIYHERIEYPTMNKED